MAELKKPEQSKQAEQLEKPAQLEKPTPSEKPEELEQLEHLEKPDKPEQMEESEEARNASTMTLLTPYAAMTEEMFHEVLSYYSHVDVSREEDVTWQVLLRNLSIIRDAGIPLTRQSLVTALYRYVLTHSDIPIPADCADLSCYSDVDKMESYTKDAFSWAISCGIVKGTNGCLNPSEELNRIQFSIIFDRFCACYDP